MLTKRRLFFYVPAVLLFAYAAIGFVILPYWIKGPLLGGFNKGIQGEIKIDKVYFNPFTLYFKVEGLSLYDTRSAGADGVDAASVEALSLRFGFVRSLYRRGIVFEALRISEPKLFFDLDTANSLNWNRVFEEAAAPSRSTPEATTDAQEEEAIFLETLEAFFTRFPLFIDVLSIEEGHLRFRDERMAKPFDFEFDALSFEVFEFVSDPENRNPYTFVAEAANGLRLGWEGVFSLFPLRSEASVEISGLRPGNFSPYYESLANFEIQSGEIGIQLAYKFAPLDASPAIELSRLDFEMLDLVLAQPAEDAAALIAADESVFLKVPRLEISGLQVDIYTRALSLEAISVQMEYLGIERFEDGTIHLAKLIRPNPSEVPKDATQDASIGQRLPEPSLEAARILFSEAFSEAWDFQMSTFEWTIKGVRIVDPSRLHEPVEIGNFTLQVKDIRNQGVDPIEGRGSLEFAEGGLFSLKVLMDPNLTAIKSEWKGERIDLVPFYRMFKPDVTAELLSAHGSFILDLTIEEATTDFRAILGGSIEVDGLALVEGDNLPLFSVDSIAMDGIHLDTEQGHYAFSQLLVEAPAIQLRRDKNGQLNLNRALTPKATGQTTTETPHPMPEAAASRAPEAASQAPNIRVGTIQIQDSTFLFEESSIDPPAQLQLERIFFESESFKLGQTNDFPIKLSGRSSTGGNFSLQGSLRPVPSPDQLEAKMTLALTNFGLLPLSSYAANFIGYPIDGGSLNLDSKFEIEGLKLNSVTDLNLSHFELSREASGKASLPVPIHLGISLLKDRNEQIALREIPLFGDFSNPETNVRGLVVQVIVRVIGNVASRPFALLGNAFGGRQEALEAAFFEPGSTEVLPESLEAIKVLADALFERPLLELVLVPNAPGELDRRALAKTHLMDRITDTSATASNPDLRNALRLLEWEPSGEDESIDRAGLALVYSQIKEAEKMEGDEAKRTTEAETAVILPTPETVYASLVNHFEHTAISGEALIALSQARMKKVKQLFLDSGDLAEERIRLGSTPEEPLPEPGIAFRLK